MAIYTAEAKKIFLQKKELRKLLEGAKHTLFGRRYNFSEILKAEDLCTRFKETIPIQDYGTQKIWWNKCLRGEGNIVCPGTINYFALSSGTSDDSSKFIPVSSCQLAQFKRQGVRFAYHIAKNPQVPVSTFLRRNLLVGGSTNLQFGGLNYSGDLSGILQLNVPFWYQKFSAPSKNTMPLNWADKIERIAEEAKYWNISIITGIPSWVQLVLEKIIERYKLKSIHELWPNLNIYIHSGIRADPYHQSINRLFGKKVLWYECYLASEGFFAYQVLENARGMRLILDDSIYFEFVPFNDSNVNANGTIKPNAKAFSIQQIEEGVDYVLLITTASGAWRYVIGDTIQFVDTSKAEIIVSGRTSHFLSVSGEHLSLDNMNQAIQHISHTFGFDCKEFTVFAEKVNDKWFHQWYIGCDFKLSAEELKRELDEKLKQINADYQTERMFALDSPHVSLLPNHVFYNFLQSRGKTGGQIKFPRVLKDKILQDWKNYMVAENNS